MSSKKVSSRLRTIIKAIGFGCLVPAIAIYIIVARPNFQFANGVAHTIFPVFHAIGDAISWPFRAGGKIVKRIHRIAILEEENEELRAKLAVALAKQTDCDVAILENKKLFANWVWHEIQTMKPSSPMLYMIIPRRIMKHL